MVDLEDSTKPTGYPSTQSPIAYAGEVLDGILQTVRRRSTLLSRLNIQKISFGLSEAIELLDKIDVDDLRSMSAIANVGAAMNHLRNVLSALQVGSGDHPDIDTLTQTVAKMLAMLYPLSRIEASKIPDDPLRAKTPPPDYIKERRVAPRIAIEAEVGFQSESNFFMGFSEDVSTGGLFIATYDTRPIGDVLNLNFTLPDGHLISVDGVVRWVREYNETTPETPPGMGIQFERLAPEDKETIEMFIEERPAMFYDDG